MIPKQDRQGVRQAREIEQKYDLNKDFSSIEKLAANANKTAQNAQSAANNAATLAEEVNTSLEAFSKSTTAQFETVNGDINELSESVSTDIHNLDERMTELENSDFDGEDGFSPTVELSKSGGVTTLKITDKNGTKTATINDGADGYTPIKGVDYVDGKDGYTPVKGVDYVDGKDGYTPVKGVDYTDGKDGKDGTNATINGVNTLTIEAGDNIEIEQVGNVLRITSTASGGGSFEALTIDEIKEICGYGVKTIHISVTDSGNGVPTLIGSVGKLTVAGTQITSESAALTVSVPNVEVVYTLTSSISFARTVSVNGTTLGVVKASGSKVSTILNVSDGDTITVAFVM